MSIKPLSFAVLAALLAVTSATGYAADYYVGDTGREARPSIALPSSSAMASSTSDSASAAPVVEIPVGQLYYKDVEKAIVASGLDKIAVQSEGIETTLRTFAEIQVSAITGKPSFEKQDSVFTVLGMIYQNQEWVRVKMIPVESADLAEAFGLDRSEHNRVSPVWVMKNPSVRTLVMGQLSGTTGFSDKLSEDAQDGLKKFAYRMASFLNLPGEFKLVPMAGTPSIWLSPSQLQTPELLNDPDLAHDVAHLDLKKQPYGALMQLDVALRQAYDTKTAPTGLAPLVDRFLAQADAAPGYMNDRIRALDHWQTRVHPFKRSAQLFMLAFLLFVGYLMSSRRKRGKGDPVSGGTGDTRPLIDGRAEEYSSPKSVAEGDPSPTALAMQKLLNPGQEPGLAMSSGGAVLAGGEFINTPEATRMAESGFLHREADFGDPILDSIREVPAGSKGLWIAAYGLMLLAAVMLAVALVNRAFIGGRMPVSNMYESITFAMGAFAIVALGFEGVYRRGWVGVGASFFGWFLMTMANSMPLHSRKVEPLVAVLNSVWLNFHVTSLLISYSLFLLAFVGGILFLIKDMTGNRPGMLPRAETFEYLIYRCVQIGWPLLTLGIFLGAVWANTAWGSFWSWDPKETWALITWLTYTIYLHLRINLGWNGRRSVVASMIGFGMVLITYFGVSYLPGLSGGLHSYAEPIKR